MKKLSIVRISYIFTFVIKILAYFHGSSNFLKNESTYRKKKKKPKNIFIALGKTRFYIQNNKAHRKQRIKYTHSALFPLRYKKTKLMELKLFRSIRSI